MEVKLPEIAHVVTLASGERFKPPPSFYTHTLKSKPDLAFKK